MAQEKRPLVSFDFAVKYLLRDKSNYIVLEGFLSDLLERKVVILAVLESESNTEEMGEKLNRVDIKVQLDGSEIVIVEVQFTYEYDFFQRALFGASRAVVEQLGAKSDYGDLKKVYSVTIVYFNWGYGDDYIYHGKTHFKGLHNKSDELRLTKDQQSYFSLASVPGDLYPEYYIIKVRKFDDQVRCSLDEWVYLFKHNDMKGLYPSAALVEAQRKLDYLSMPAGERVLYEKYRHMVSQDKALVSLSGQRYYEGVDDGIAIGEKRGEERGLAIGEERGIAIGEKRGIAQKALEVAEKLLKRGNSIEEASEISGLPLETVRKIIKEEP
jgi:predicted transposase/invertase (TIGR01784 family)